MSNYLQSLFLLIGLFTVVPCNGENHDRVQLAALLDAQLANNMAIRSFDYLLRTDILEEPVFTAGYTSTIFERLVMDWDSEQFLYLRRRRAESLDGKLAYAESIGVIFTDGQGRGFRNGKSINYGRATVLEVLAKHDVPDFRLATLPVNSENSNGSDWTNERIKAFKSMMAISDEIKLESASHGRLKFSLEDPNNLSGYRWYFDDQRLVPIHTELTSRSERWVLSSFEWKRINEIDVPVLVSRSFSPLQLPPDFDHDDLIKNPKKVIDSRRKVLTTSDARYHWLSVNRKQADDFFSLDRIDDPTELLKLTDPVLCGATALSDRAENR